MKLLLLAPSTGVRWFQETLRIFMRQPLGLCFLTFLYLCMVSLLSIVPVLGTVAGLVLTPAISLGIMAGAQAVSTGQFPSPGLMLLVFRAEPAKLRAMLILGGLYCLTLTVCLLLGLWLGGVLDNEQVMDIFLKNAPINEQVMESAEFQRAILLLMISPVPATMLFWFAPALVYWYGVSPLKSLFFSAVAIWRNVLALSVNTFLWMGFVVMCMTVLSFLASALGTAVLLIFSPALMLGILSTMYVSMLITSRDCFAQEQVQI